LHDRARLAFRDADAAAGAAEDEAVGDGQAHELQPDAGRHIEAVRDYARAAPQIPTMSEPSLRWGYSLLALGRVDEALVIMLAVDVKLTVIMLL